MEMGRAAYKILTAIFNFSQNKVDVFTVQIVKIIFTVTISENANQYLVRASHAKVVISATHYLFAVSQIPPMAFVFLISVW